MNVIGKIKVLNETQNVSATFKKRELVVTTDEQYPQMIMIEFAQDKCDILDNYKVGDSVNVSINLRGREWINPEGVAKYFNQIQGWRIEKTDGSSLTQSHVPTTSNNPQSVPQPTNSFADDDQDLPF
jgi:hypothetical protein